MHGVSAGTYHTRIGFGRVSACTLGLCATMFIPGEGPRREFGHCNCCAGVRAASHAMQSERSLELRCNRNSLPKHRHGANSPTTSSTAHDKLTPQPFPTSRAHTTSATKDSQITTISHAHTTSHDHTTSHNITRPHNINSPLQTHSPLKKRSSLHTRSLTY